MIFARSGPFTSPNASIASNVDTDDTKMFTRLFPTKMVDKVLE